MSTRRKRAGRIPAIPPPVQPYGQCRLRAHKRQVMTRTRNNSAMPEPQHGRSWPYSRSRTGHRPNEAMRRRSPY